MSTNRKKYLLTHSKIFRFLDTYIMCHCFTHTYAEEFGNSKYSYRPLNKCVIFKKKSKLKRILFLTQFSGSYILIVRTTPVY